MNRSITDIAGKFRIEGTITGFTEVTTGHINDSYHITTDNCCASYFLQWVNSYIFKDVEGLMKNIEIVTRHIADKVRNLNGIFTVPELVPALDGKTFIRDSKGEYWRLYQYIPGTHVYDIVENTTIAYQGGKAFGQFMSYLSDLPASALTETIPDFHNMEWRIAKFRESLNNDSSNRAANVGDEVRFVLDRAGSMLEITNLIRKGDIPTRITHNDTKFNNILFNGDNQAICIVDLDTVMPGSILFDFGDAIRTGANTACEDEKDLEKVDINLEIYEAYSRGFIQSTRHTLTPLERNKLAFSARFMTYIIGLRFLTDYLDGDPYFRTSHPEHNLERTRVQFRLIQAMESKAGEMEKIISRACE